MKSQDPCSDPTAAPSTGPGRDLRQKAETLAADRAALNSEDIANHSPEEFQRVFHELRVHQIELEMQNEELRRTQAEIEAGRARYFDLYDLAPVSYCTLSGQGLILEANLTAATLLGRARGDLIRQPLSRFILKEDQDIYYLRRKMLLETGDPQECDLRLGLPDGTFFWVQLRATAAQAEDGAPVCRLVLSDITERKRGEEQTRMQHTLALSLVAASDLQQGLRLCLETALQGAGLDAGGFYLVDEISGALDLWVPQGLTAGFVEAASRFDASSDQNRLIMAGLPVYAGFKDLGLSLSDPERREGLRFIAVIPLHHDGRVIGCMNVASHVADDLPPARRKTLETIAATATQAIARLRAEERLRANETLLNEAERLSKVGGWEWDLIRQTTVWTAEMYRLHDFSAQDLAPGSQEHIRRSAACYGSEHQAAILEAFRRCVERGEPYDLEVPFTSVKGRPMWVRTTAQAVWEDNRIVKVLGNLMDITGRKQAEEALREREQQHRLLVKNLHAGVVVHAPDTHIVLANEQASELLGLSVDQLIGKTAIDPAWRFIREDETVMPLEEYPVARVLATGQPLRDLVIGINRPTTEDLVWVLVNAFPEADVEGQLCQIVVTFIDITERRQAEEALRESETRFRFLVDYSYDVIWTLTSGGDISYVSPSWKTRLGHEADSAIGKPFAAFVHPDDVTACEIYMARVLEARCALPGPEYRGRHADGSWRWYEAGMTPVYAQDGSFMYFVGVSRDITERKRQDATLAFLALAGADPATGDFFRVLARHISETLDMGFVCIDRLDGDHLTAHTLAVFSSGRFEDNISYALKDTPCGEVVGKQVCCFPAAVKTLFPNDEVLQQMEAESYIGVTLWSHDGRPIGLIAVIGTRPMTNREQAEALLKLVAVRAAAELELNQGEEALRLSESRFRNAFEHSGTGMALVSPEGKWLKVNKRVCDIVGYTAEELMAKTFQDITHPEDLDSDLAFVRQMLAGAIETYQIEKRYLRKDGHIVWVLLTVSLVWEEPGVPLHFISQIMDITGRKRAEEALRQSEERNRLLSDLTMEGILLHRNAVAIDLNLALAGMMGLERDELLAKNFMEFVHLDDRSLVLEHLSKEYAPPYTVRMVKNTGESFFAEIESHDFQQQGDLLRVSAIRDITGRKLAEEALRESETKFRTLVEASSSGIWKTDAAGYNTYASPRWCEIAGMSAAAAAGQGWAAGLHPDDRMQIRTGWEAAATVSRPYSSEFRFVHPDGRIVWVLCQASPVMTGDHIVEWIGTITDITGIKHAEIEREALQAQLTQAQKLESVGRLAGGVAHDFNNMLGVIIGHAEFAMEKAPPATPLHADLVQIHQAAQRSAGLTRQLLAFARKQAVAPKVLDLNDTIGSMLNLLRRLIGENIDLLWKPGPGLWPVRMDPTQIEQILTNLCVNSRDAIADVGQVTVETGNTVFNSECLGTHAGVVPGEYVMLSASDNGCGMDSETLPHLFEPFFTTKQKGTGLGLAIVHGVVKQNRGFIEVHSKPGEGTIIRIYLPRHADAASAAAAETKDPGLPAAGHASGTILLVEDEPMLLYLGRTVMERMGYTVLAAATPGEAIRLVRESARRIDLLMTDVVMPEMNGLDLAKTLLSIKPGMRLLFMSGYTADVIADHGVLDEGAHFIQKPFSITKLEQKLHEVLQS